MEGFDDAFKKNGKDFRLDASRKKEGPDAAFATSGP
jgi:hypothetical protein